MAEGEVGVRVSELGRQLGLSTGQNNVDGIDFLSYQLYTKYNPKGSFGFPVWFNTCLGLYTGLCCDSC